MNNKVNNNKQNRLIFKEKQSHVVNNNNNIDNNKVVHDDNIIHATNVIENDKISDRNVCIVENLQSSDGDTDEIEMKKVIENDINHDNNDEHDKIDNNVVTGSMKADTDVNVDVDDDGGEIVGSVDLKDEHHPSTDVEVTSIEINNNKEELDNNSVVDNHNDDNDDNQSKNIRNDNDYDHVKTSITENDGIITIDESKTTIDGDEINAVKIA